MVLYVYAVTSHNHMEPVLSIAKLRWRRIFTVYAMERDRSLPGQLSKEHAVHRYVCQWR